MYVNKKQACHQYITCQSDNTICEGTCTYTHPAGPDGVTDYKVEIKDPKYIGHGTMSPEGTGDVQYLCRAAEVNCN